MYTQNVAFQAYNNIILQSVATVQTVHDCTGTLVAACSCVVAYMYCE